jgi:hypothetical protein
MAFATNPPPQDGFEDDESEDEDEEDLYDWFTFEQVSFASELVSLFPLYLVSSVMPGSHLSRLCAALRQRKSALKKKIKIKNIKIYVLLSLFMK